MAVFEAEKRTTEDFTGTNDGRYSGSGVPSRNRHPSAT
jgi:hypothetical protein